MYHPCRWAECQFACKTEEPIRIKVRKQPISKGVIFGKCGYSNQNIVRSKQYKTTLIQQKSMQARMISYLAIFSCVCDVFVHRRTFHLLRWPSLCPSLSQFILFLFYELHFCSLSRSISLTHFPLTHTSQFSFFISSSHLSVPRL